MKRKAKKGKTAAEIAAWLALVLLRYARGWWEQGMLAEEAGFLRSQLSKWDRGERLVPDHALERTADVTEFPRALLPVLLRALRSFLVMRKARSRLGQGLAEVSVLEVLPLAVAAVDLILDPMAVAPSVERAEPLPSDRDAAELLWERLRRWPERQRSVLIEQVEEFRHWGVVEHLVAASLHLAPNHPQEALGWAKQAARLADLVPGSEAWRQRLQGYAGIALINACRVCSDLPASRAAQARAVPLWAAGEPGDPGLLLNPALLPCIEAALHRDDREWPQALGKVAAALALANGEMRGKILLTKASIHNALDEPEAATAANLEAAALIDAESEPRLLWGASYNLVTDLLHLGRVEEASRRLPEVQALAERLGGELDAVRVTWMTAKIDDGLGNLEAARAGFERARSAFLETSLSYDCALVSLDLCLVLLKQGDTKTVRTIAVEMGSIFQSQQVHPAALAALRIFCEAARREAATVELTRQVARFLHRAQGDPELKFEG